MDILVRIHAYIFSLSVLLGIEDLRVESETEKDARGSFYALGNEMGAWSATFRVILHVI